MNISNTFTVSELDLVDDAVLLAEELVNEFYKISSGLWLKNRYDIKTARELSRNETVEGPFAQVVGYVAKRKEALLESSAFNYYTVCLQDRAILSFLGKNPDLAFFPFLVYILVHELVHIVRFTTFQQIYAVSGESKIVEKEEATVHAITRKIVTRGSVAGMDRILACFRQPDQYTGFDKIF